MFRTKNTNISLTVVVPHRQLTVTSFTASRGFVVVRGCLMAPILAVYL